MSLNQQRFFSPKLGGRKKTKPRRRRNTHFAPVHLRECDIRAQEEKYEPVLRNTLAFRNHSISDKSRTTTSLSHQKEYSSVGESFVMNKARVVHKIDIPSSRDDFLEKEFVTMGNVDIPSSTFEKELTELYDLDRPLALDDESDDLSQSDELHIHHIMPFRNSRTLIVERSTMKIKDDEKKVGKRKNFIHGGHWN